MTIFIIEFFVLIKMFHKNVERTNKKTRGEKKTVRNEEKKNKTKKEKRMKKKLEEAKEGEKVATINNQHIRMLDAFYYVGHESSSLQRFMINRNFRR